VILQLRAALVERGGFGAVFHPPALTGSPQHGASESSTGQKTSWSFFVSVRMPIGRAIFWCMMDRGGGRGAFPPGRRHCINLTSDWDNFLRLEDAKSVPLAEDDDGGGFPNARIVFTPTAPTTTASSSPPSTAARGRTR